MIATELKVQVKDTVFDPNLARSNTNKIHVRRGKAETPFYKVWLYLEGADLPLVDRVTYTLHESFRNPNRTVRRTPASPNCQLVIWTWGIFTVKATIADKRGNTYEVSHRLEYENELPSDKSMYDWDDSDSSSRAQLVTAN
jgi:transcription initiation factor IIF auxiliary subunit